MITIAQVIGGGGTFVAAMAIGILVQQAGAEPPRPLPAEALDMVAADPRGARGAQVGAFALVPAMPAVTLVAAVPAPPRPAPQPRRLPAAPVARAGSPDAPPAAAMPQDLPAPSFNCDLALSARAEAGAMVQIALVSPCRAGEGFLLHHQGMVISGQADASGRTGMTVPALGDPAVFTVSFADGAGAVAATAVSTLDLYDRFVLQWRGDTGLQLHAREDGADDGAPGHVWADHTRSRDAAARGEGGFLTRLGAADLPAAHVAEVFSFPSGLAPRVSAVVLSIEAEVTRATCGRAVAAQTIRVRGNGKPQLRDIALAMPGCGAKGGLLVVKNPFGDLRLARN